MAEIVEDLRKKKVDIRSFKRDFVVPDKATIASIKIGFQYGAWREEKIPDEVLDDLRKAYTKSTKHNQAYAHVLDAHLLFRQKRYKEAIKCYDKAIEIDPSDSMVFYRKGDALVKMGKHEEAVMCYDKAIEIDPSDSMVFYRKGIALTRLGKHEEAVMCYDKAIEIDPSDSMAFSRKGIALTRLGKHEEAVMCYDKANKIDLNYIIKWHYNTDTLDKHKERIKKCQEEIEKMLHKYEISYQKNSKSGMHEEMIKWHEIAKLFEDITSIDSNLAGFSKNRVKKLKITQ
ncbi:MAG: tetratricopeptide repeat protein [Nitrosopumilus sp. H13]|nr:MAG: tetratricopeptide repeat protein [Nitrosopumilus sp. H13]